MDRVLLHFDRLDDGTLVALHTHEGRSVASIVLPSRYGEGPPINLMEYVFGMRSSPSVRWVLAGDVSRDARPRGYSASPSIACAEAAQALGVELGIDVVGYEVTR